MKRTLLAGMVSALVLTGLMSGSARAIDNIYSVEYIGSSGGQWSDANAWKNISLNTTGNALAILGRNNGNNGLNNINVEASHARYATIPAGVTVNYHGNTIGDLRWSDGSVLTIESGAVWQQVTDATFTENAWTQFDGAMVLDGGTFRRSVAAPSQINDGGGIMMIGSFRDDDNLARRGPNRISIDIKSGGSLENDGQLWFGADDEHTVGTSGRVTINNGSINLTGGTFTYQNSELFVTADLAFFYDYYRDAVYELDNQPTPDLDPPPQPKNEQWEINFTGPGSITVDSAGIWVYRQDADGIWNEASAGPLSYQDLWDQGILKAHGMSGQTGILPRETNSEIARQPANFNEYFTVSGTPGTDNYTLTSITPTLQKVRYIGANGGQWSDANAWENTTTSAVGNANTILGRNNGSNGLNNISVAASHARDVTIPAGVTVNYHGNTIGDLRWNDGSILTIEEGAVWQQVTDATFTENAWTQFDGAMVLDGGTFRRSVAAPSQINDGGGIMMFGSFRDDESLPRRGPTKISVDIKNGGRLENDGQLWFGADDEHTVGTGARVNINDGHIDLTGGTFTYQNSELFVTADLAFFYDYYRDAVYELDNQPTPDLDPPPQPKNEQWVINFTGPGSITVDSAGIWVYRQDADGIWNEATAGPLEYEDLWEMGILQAFGMSGLTGILPRETNSEIARQPAIFSTYFSVSGTPGTDDYILTSLIEAQVAPGLDGDYNGDGVVDQADFVAWAKNPSAFGGDPAGYNTWKQNFGAGGPGAGSGSGAVPEPTAMLLMLVGLVPLIAFRKRAN